jgi:hypothetical protein
MACGVWSFCQEMLKKFSWQFSPANWFGPALAEIRILPASSTERAEARSTFDQM